MKVLQVIDTLSIGGAERMAVNISNALTEKGHDTMLIVTRKSGDLENFILDKVHVKILAKRFFGDVVALRLFIRLCKEFNPDVIHAHSSSIYWAVLVKVIFGSKAKLIFHDHFGMSELLKPKDRRLLRLISNYIDGVIAVNEKLQKWSKENLSINKRLIRFIPNFPHLILPSTDHRKKYTQLVCLANLRPQKDHATLTKAFGLLCKRLPDKQIKLVLAGIISSDLYLKEIELEIKALGLQKKVEILGPVNDVANLLKTSDIGVLSSKSEGLPVSLLEYGLAALPVVVTDVGQCSAVVGNGVFGKVVPPNNPEDLAQALMELINDPKAASELGRSFEKHVRQNYGAEKFLEEYFELIRTL